VQKKNQALSQKSQLFVIANCEERSRMQSFFSGLLRTITLAMTAKCSFKTAPQSTLTERYAKWGLKLLEIYKNKIFTGNKLTK
jgi:hypothetical protein